MHMHIIIVDNNAMACFDHMIKAPNNLTCLQHRASPQYIKLHAQTQKELQYHLKHKYGMSDNYNTHSINQPWHGMGQGARDTSNQWVISTDSMSNAYSHKANGWTIPSPIKQLTQKQTLKAFIDDINLFISQPPATNETTFLSMAQEDINHWHGILHATGGELNTKNICWSDFHLNYDTNRNPHLCQCMPTDPQLYLKNHNGTWETLKSIKPHEGICHLGVNISMNGNHKAEEQILIKPCQLFPKVFNHCPLTQAEAEVTYKTIFLPIITYPFPVTFLSRMILEKAQSLTMPVILSNLGYN